MSTVLVTGAAGNLGRRVTSALCELPYVERVVAVDVARLASAPGVEVHEFDLGAPGAQEELAALGKQTDAILHLAWRPEGDDNLRVMRNVLDAAGAIEPAQFVHISSATVYGAWADNPLPITEEVAPRPNPSLAYAVQKRSAEVMVEKWAEEHPGTSVALLRPACTVGAVDQPLYEALAASPRRPLGTERVVQYLHLDDLANAVVHSFEQGLAGIYNVAPDAGIREEMAGALAGGPALLPMFAAVRAGSSNRRWNWRRHGVLPGAQPYAEHSWVVSGDKLKTTGWKPEYNSEQALVVSDSREHWEDMPQGRRVSLVLGGAAATVVAVGAGGAAWWRHRH
ncbi:MAG TPA: NAD-dependent epimerase/dehydratase family protein [Acidimicrobiales bacterium]|nr:NAD-dependent epimerase/dehydratase family protein [Acidimicrobiales bacterium]